MDIKNIKSTYGNTIIKKILEYFIVEIRIYKLISVKTLETIFDDNKVTTHVNTNLTNDKNPYEGISTDVLRTITLILSELPEQSFSVEWNSALSDQSIFNDLYQLTSVISIVSGGNVGQITSIIQKLHQKMFSPKYNLGISKSSETIKLSQSFDTRIYAYDDQIQPISNLLKTMQYLQLTENDLKNFTTISSSVSVSLNEPKDVGISSKIANLMKVTAGNVLQAQNIQVDQFLKLEANILSNLSTIKQFNVDNYIFTIHLPQYNYKSPYMVLRSLSYSFDGMVAIKNGNSYEYMPKVVKIDMDFEPSIPRPIIDTKSTKIDYVSSPYKITI